MNHTNNQNKINVGVDVGKRQLDIYIRPLGIYFSVSNDEYKTKNEIIQSMPDIGNVVAFNLLSNMPELGTINNKEVASLVGVAPFNRESGSYKGKRMIRGGRSQIRTVMYMAMLSAIQCNSKFKTMYQSLLSKGKPKKVALVACIRKMIVILNSMVRDGVMWDEKMV